MDNFRDFPKWNKIWIYWVRGAWDFTPTKENIPDGAYACEYTLNNDPFICKVVKTVLEERS